METDELKQLGVMIVDDNVQLCEVFSLILSRNGYTNLHIAYDGYDAIHLLSKLGSSIYVVLLDLKMPKVDGFGVIKHLLNNHEHQIGVVIITGFWHENEAEYNEVRNVIDSKNYDKSISYLTRFPKPFDTNRLQNEVNKVLLSIFEKRKIKNQKENKEDDSVVIDLNSCIEKCQTAKSIESYQDSIINTLDEIKRCYITECYMATILLCGKILEYMLKQVLIDNKIKFHNDLNLGGLIKKIRKNGIEFDPSFDNIVGIISQNRNSAINAQEEIQIITRGQTVMVLYVMMETIKKVVEQDREQQTGTKNKIPELDVHDRVFPFTCDNSECGHEFDEQDFVEVIQLWGCIYMSQADHMILGLTCPHCLKTTVRKYPIIALDCSIETFKRQIPGLQYFVPFSTKILLETEQITEDINQLNNPDDSFRLPDGFRLIPDGLEKANGYLKRIMNEFPFYIAESSIPALVKFENESSVRAIPRIVPAYSAYRAWESLLAYYDPYGEDQPADYPALNRMIFQACCWQYEKSRSFGPGDPWSRYFKFIENEFNSYELEDFDYDGSVEEGIHPKYVRQIIKEYAIFRNTIEFEFRHRVKFAAKPARLLYYREGSSIKRNKQSGSLTKNFADMPLIGVDVPGRAVCAPVESGYAKIKDPQVNDNPVPLAEQMKPQTVRYPTKCKEKCREIAKEIWSRNPNITIREMSEVEEILEYTKNQQGELYSEKTIRDWIKDLCPNRSPGRPKKT